MMLDSFLQLSDAQALTATAASTNHINLGSDRDMGKGEPMALVVTVGVALAGTSPTFQVAIQTDDNSSFSSATTLQSSETFTALAAGDKVVVPLGHTNEQYLRANYTLGGTSPTVTVDAYFQPLRLIDGYENYASGYTVS